MFCRRSCSVLTNHAFTSRFYSKKALKVDPTFLEVLKPLESFTQRLIDSSAAGDANHRHRDGVQLWSTIPQVEKPHEAVPSMEKARFVGDETLPDILAGPLRGDSMHEDFPPGTFVEIRRWVAL